MTKTFLLCVGCQKGGTTWLHNYLKNHPNSQMGFRKEYHVFDALHVPECRGFLRANVAKAADIFSARKLLLSRRDRENIMHAAFYANPDVYFNYFRELVSGSEKVTLTGDITPSYAALPINALREIKSELEERDFNVKVIFLMRDPVSRCVSAMRMHRRKYSSFERDENLELLDMYASPDFEIRTRYERTIHNLESVFAAEDILYDFYETLFLEETIEKIASFLSLPYVQPNFEKKLNFDKSKVVLSEETLRKVFDYYRGTYDFVVARYGSEKISKIWSGYRKFGVSA